MFKLSLKVAINNNGYVPFVIITIRSFPHSWLIIGFVTRVTLRALLLVKQELLNCFGATEFIPTVCSVVRVIQPVVFLCSFVDQCLSVCPFALGHCIVCRLIYGFWLPLWYLHTFQLFIWYVLIQNDWLIDPFIDIQRHYLGEQLQLITL
jgi:hypothetical protein